MLSKKKSLLVLAVSFVVTSISFQNCSEVGFSQNEVPSIVDKSSVSFSILHTPSAQHPDVDILFVVDESSSMNSILTEVRAGLESTSLIDFPQNTKIAFTNMAPAALDDQGEILFSQSYVRNQLAESIPFYPGFMKLVSETSIANFLAQPDLPAGLLANFSEPGCGEWFSPGETNRNGVSCIEAASQIALTGTGIEAGVVSLYQLTQGFTQRGKKLFRDGSVANVVFISDTHDAGGGYYGRSRAYSEMPSVDELKSTILANNSNIADVKFSGIVPVPEQGNPLLSGLNTIGELALTLEDVEDLSGEQLNDFSYLDFIKETGGVAVHAQNSNWTQAMEQLIRTTGTTSRPLLDLGQSCVSIESLELDGVLIPASDYRLLDSQTLQVDREGLESRVYTFDVTCSQ